MDQIVIIPAGSTENGYDLFLRKGRDFSWKKTDVPKQNFGTVIRVTKKK
jgi:hypothetical protein